jgi:hypothetical protein
MIDGIIIKLVANDGRGLSKILKSSFAGVAEVMMQSGRRRSCHKCIETGG